MTLTLALMTGGREHVLSQLEADPTWKRVRIKSPEGAASRLVEMAKRIALEEAAALIKPEIDGWYKDYVKKNGPRPEANYNDWEEGHDDGLLALFEPFASVLSGSWLGFATTDIRLWQDGENDKLANSFAQEVWKQLSWKRTDNQILAGVGITHDDLTVYGPMPQEPAPKPKPEYNAMSVNEIINRIMIFMPDLATLDDNLDMASDDDDALAEGAAQRLGITMADVAVLRDARQVSSQAVQAWHNAIEQGQMLEEHVHYVDLEPVGDSGLKDTLATSLGDYPIKANGLPPLPPRAHAPLPTLPPLPKHPPPLATGTKTLPPLPASTGVGSAPGVNQGRGGRRAKVTNEPPAGHIALEVLRSIKENAGTRDEDLADLLGISRPTLANIMKGKTWYVPPDPSRREAIKNMLKIHADALMAAREAISTW